MEIRDRLVRGSRGRRSLYEKVLIGSVRRRGRHTDGTVWRVRVSGHVAKGAVYILSNLVVK